VRFALELARDGRHHMARDSAMLESAERGEASACVYTWEGLWVSLGRNQSAPRALVDCDATRWVSRPTGGAAVLHGHDVTVSVALPLHKVSGVRDTYRSATMPLVCALNAVGIEAALAEDVAGERVGAQHEDCFASTSRNDIVDPHTLEKVCGCALRRTRLAVLVQASIPAGEPLVDPRLVIVGGVRQAACCVDPAALLTALREAF
jgi:lipoyl(octanoyl) transferase